MPEPVFTELNISQHHDGCAFNLNMWQLDRGLNPSLMSRTGRYLWSKRSGPGEYVWGGYLVSEQSARENPLNTPPWADSVVWIGPAFVLQQTGQLT